MIRRIWSPVRFAGARWPRLALALLLALGALAALPPAPARAAMRTVTTGADAGPGSLRAALDAAAAGDTIAFAPGVTTVTLTSGTLVIAKSLTIRGVGTGGVRVERSAAAPAFRIFEIRAVVTVTISGLTITKGSAFEGGGIYSAGTLTLTNATVTGNEANGTYANGGGLVNTGTLILTSSTISNNVSRYRGGGITNTGTILVYDSTISGNSVSNTPVSQGSGLTNLGTVRLSNSTISGNRPVSALFNQGSMDVTNVTIADNEGSGLLNVTVGMTTTNTIFAGNQGPNCDGGGGSGNRGGNVDDGSTCGFGAANGSVSNALAPLAPLGDYGGPTQTHAIVPGNLGIDRTVGCPAADQRGVPRPQGAPCDSGAYESRGFALSVASGSGQSAFVTTPFAAPLVVTARSAFGEPVQGGVVTFAGPAVGASLQPSRTLATIGADGRASAAVVANGVVGGPYPVVATAAGAPAATFSLTNFILPTALVVAPISGPYGAMTTLQATLTLNGVPFGGQLVYFTRHGAPVGSATTDGSGVARLNVYVPVVAAGTYPAGVKATFAGSTFHAASSGTAALTITKANQTIDFPQPPGRTFGDPPFAVSATASSSLPVRFSAGPAGVCAASGANGATITLVGAGDCAITANQPGDTNFLPAPGVALVVSVGKRSQTIAFAQPPGRTFGNAPFGVIATATSGLPIVFRTDTPTVCAVGAPTTPTSATVTILAAGDCTLVARQPGDATRAAAPDVRRTFAIDRAAQTIAFGTPAGSPAYALNDAFTVGASATSALAVTFAVSGACAIAGTTVTGTGVGVCTVTASQAGDTNYRAAPDVARTFAIDPRAQSIAFGIPAGTPAYTVGQTFAVAATATSGLPVAFAAAPVDVCAIAGTTVTGTGAGTCTVTASQAGDATYRAAPHAIRTFAIAAPPPGALPAPSPAPTISPAPTPSPTADPSPGGSAPSFADVPPDHWAHDQIAPFAQRGITTGCDTDAQGNRYYCPERGVTRAEMAAFLTRALGQDKVAPSATPTFADVSADYWAYGPIEAFAKLGITIGCGVNDLGQRLFCPERGVTRAEMAAFLDRARGQGELLPPAPTFADVSAAYWAYGWIERFLALGVTTGCGEDAQGRKLYCPDRGVTRAEMAVFIIRAYP